VRWLWLVLVCVMWLSWGSSALAHTVLLLQAPNPSPATTELVERLRGELLSLGFEVMVRDRSESPARAVASEALQRMLTEEADCDAAVDVVGEATPVAVDVWVIDRARRVQLLTRVKLDANSESTAKGLAIHASEVLRAHLFETPVDRREQRSKRVEPLSSAQANQVESRPSQPSGSLGIELGAAASTSLDGLGPAILPLLRVDWAIAPELVLEGTLAGFGTRPSVATSAGNAQVAMQYALLGACYRLDWDHRLRPLAALSLGALHTAAVGQAELPREGHSVEQWSFLFDASLGAAFWLSRRYAVVLAGHVQLAQPYVAIRFGEQQVASLGRPNLLVSLTLGVWP